MKAIALFSGGLDSILAIRIVLDQGIEIKAVNFFASFCHCSHKCEAKRVADNLGMELEIFNISAEYIKMIKAPKYGYGKNLNPCIDCKILMYRRAKKYMREIDASFIITGEVLGQRPMSQYRKALDIIERESGLEGLILRPLSAKLLPISIPEKEGWIDRKKMLGISGKSRKIQIALAKEYNINDYSCPAGGCLLTDAGFVRRVNDLIKYSELTLNDIELLKVGRHFRLSPKAKVIVGRNKEENAELLRLAQRGDFYFVPVEINGPIGIGRGDFDQTTITLSSQIIARYSDSLQGMKAKIAVKNSVRKEKSLVIVRGIKNEHLDTLRI